MNIQLHQDVRTTPAIRLELQAQLPTVSNRALAQAYHLNRHTVAKWRQREGTENASHRPQRLQTTFSAAKRQCLSGDHHTYLDFRYLSCVLGELSYEHYRHSDNLVVQLNLPNMQYPAGHKVEVYAQAVRGLTTL